MRATDLYANKAAEKFVVQQIQISGNKTFSDAKKRIADVITAMLRGEQADVPAVKSKEIRLWLSNDKDTLLQSFNDIGKLDHEMQDQTEQGAASK